jgi:hypothetical protein
LYFQSKFSLANRAGVAPGPFPFSPLLPHDLGGDLEAQHGHAETRLRNSRIEAQAPDPGSGSEGSLSRRHRPRPHCNVPRDKTAFSAWVQTQRSNYNTLRADRPARLESLGFDWDPYETAWTAMLPAAYNEPNDQPALTRQFDFDEAATVPSFARLRRKLGSAMASGLFRAYRVSDVWAQAIRRSETEGRHGAPVSELKFAIANGYGSVTQKVLAS